MMKISQNTELRERSSQKREILTKYTIHNTYIHTKYPFCKLFHDLLQLKECKTYGAASTLTLCVIIITARGRQTLYLAKVFLHLVVPCVSKTFDVFMS